MDTNIEKYNFLSKRYGWKADPILGAVNWNWRSVWVAALFKFKGDCDKYAFLTSKLMQGGKKYAILPYNPKYWKRMHVVYVYHDTVFSSGWWHKNSLPYYLKFAYDKIDYFLVEIY